MVVLKKIKASSLMETMVATVLIIIVFTVASLAMNNLFKNTIQYRTHAIENHLNVLVYQYRNQQLSLPYREVYQEWEIYIATNEDAITTIEATQASIKRTLKRIIIN